MDADGSDTRQLTDTPRYDENPAWAPDGSLDRLPNRTGREFRNLRYEPGRKRPTSAVQAAHPAGELWPFLGIVLGLPTKPAAAVQLTPSHQALGMPETFQRGLGGPGWRRRSSMPSLPTQWATPPRFG